MGLAVAVIGAGISGLACANNLRQQGFDIKVFEKSRGVGGRIATRRADLYGFDHGAQYFTVRSDPFHHFIEPLIKEGLVAEWSGRLATFEYGVFEEIPNQPTRYVGVPTMNTIAKYLAKDLPVLTNTHITKVAKNGSQWILFEESGHKFEGFDILVLAIPPFQASLLIDDFATDLATKISKVKMLPCWALMLAYENRLKVPFDGLFVNQSKISWVARNSSKPERSGECWVVHASASWSEKELEKPKDIVYEQLMEVFNLILASSHIPLQTPLFSQTHRWRYAIPSEVLPDSSLFDESLNIGLCGDWCAGPRVEGAYLSGVALSNHIAAKSARNGISV
ncbi:MAG: FAD-dependent oxidoreductase [Blastocatellia bacterium]|nr:FAD-dependent oxidoreductase [Blastocatellia bacterium]